MFQGNVNKTSYLFILSITVISKHFKRTANTGDSFQKNAKQFTIYGVQINTFYKTSVHTHTHSTPNNTENFF